MSHDPAFLSAFADEAPLGRAPRTRRPVSRGRVWRVFFLGLFGLVCVFVILLVVAAGKTYAAGRDAQEALLQARTSAMQFQFQEADLALARAGEDLARAHTSFRVFKVLYPIPWVGDQLRAGDALLVTGEEGVSALRRVVGLGGDLVRLSGLTASDLSAITEGLAPSVTFNDLDAGTKRAILLRLSAASETISLIRTDLSLASEALNAVPSDTLLAPLRDLLLPLRDELTSAVDDLETVSVGTRLLPALAGLGMEKTYLLLFLNNDELRPGGGFIGSFGVLQVEDGDIRSLQTFDSYTLDDAAQDGVAFTPPAPLARWNAAGEWLFRDANWSPDFSASARQALYLFGHEIAVAPQDVQTMIHPPAAFDGVIAITPTLVSDLLRLTGPLEVGEQTFTAENFSAKLAYQVEYGYRVEGIPPAQRKEVLGELVNVLKEKLFHLPVSRWPELLEVARANLSEKQALLYATDAGIQSTIETAGWGGRVTPKEGADVQMLVDANLASLKTDPSVERSLAYEAFKNVSGQWVGRTTVHYAHHGTFSWNMTRYRTYTRLYVPKGSTLLRIEGSEADDLTQNPSHAPAPFDVGEEFGLTSFGTFTSIEPGESKDLVFEYTLAPEVAEALEGGAPYRLQVLKQPGSQNIGLTLDIAFGKNVARAEPPENRIRWGDARYSLETVLSADTTFVVAF